MAACVTVVVAGLRLLPTSGDATVAAGSVGAAADGAEGFTLSPEELAEADAVSRSGDGRAEPTGPTSEPQAARSDQELPAASGAGRRVVFSEGLQRVWLVDSSERIRRTYPVSGSVFDNLFPGAYEVYSRSRHAVGIADSGTMEYFVRFTQGTNGGAIGFHTIPIDDGARVQTVGQLGTPLSHGCIRQATSDAVALWEFAPIGTTVVVTP